MIEKGEGMDTRIRVVVPWLLVFYLGASPGMGAEPGQHPQERPANLDESAEEIFEEELLQLIAPDQLEALDRGAPASSIVLTTGETLKGFLAEGEPEYRLLWTSVGATADSSGGSFALSSSTEPFAGVSAAASFELTVGLVRIDGGGDSLFEDGFESGDTTGWSNSTP